MSRSLTLAAAALMAFPAASQTTAPTICSDDEIESAVGAHACRGIDLYAHIGFDELTTAAQDSTENISANDIWGWTDPETGKEYALTGLSNGTSFVDISDPGNPVVVGELPTQTTSTTWRDIKVYDDHAFIVSEAEGHGMQVFDLTRLRDVTEREVFEADAHFDGVGNTHNIAIDEESAMAYLIGTDQCSGGLYMVDISDPMNPVEAGCYADPQNAYIHDSQCLVYNGPDADYAGKPLCINSNEQFLTIVDVSDAENPALISRAFYPNPAYTHQNWLTEDGRFLIANDELDDSNPGTRTLFFNVEDLDNPQYLTAFYGPTEATDHNLYVRGNYVFTSNYAAGLRIYDVSNLDEEDIREVAYFDTYPEDDAHGFNGQWSNYPYFESGVVIANDINHGLFILKPNAEFMPDPL